MRDCRPAPTLAQTSGPGMMADQNKPMNPPATRPAAETRSRKRMSRPLPQDDVAHSAASRLKPERLVKALDHARICARIADDNRGKEILLLDLQGATPLIDYFVIASANSRRQAYAIASEIDQEMKKRGEFKLGMEGAEEGRWILVDYGDLVVHIFSEDARTYYALEEIWGDAPRLEWRDPSRPRPPTVVEDDDAPLVPEASADDDIDFGDEDDDLLD